MSRASVLALVVVSRCRARFRWECVGPNPPFSRNRHLNASSNDEEALWAWGSSLVAGAPTSSDELQLAVTERRETLLQALRTIRCLVDPCDKALAVELGAYFLFRYSLAIASDDASPAAEKERLVSLASTIATHQERRLDDSVVQRDGVLFSASGEKYIKLAMCASTTARAGLVAAGLGDWGVALAIPESERPVYDRLCGEVLRQGGRCSTFDVVATLAAKHGGSYHGPRLHKVRSMRHTPFARFTMFLDNDATLTPHAAPTLRAAISAMVLSGAQMAMSAETSPVWSHKKKTRRLLEGQQDKAPGHHAQRQAQSDECPRMKRHHPRETFIHPWVIPEINSGTILYKRSAQLDLFFQRWEHYIAAGAVLNPTPTKDQKALLLAYEDTLPIAVTLESLGIDNPRTCCGECRWGKRKHARPHPTWCTCTVCHGALVACDTMNTTLLAQLHAGDRNAAEALRYVVPLAHRH